MQCKVIVGTRVGLIAFHSDDGQYVKVYSFHVGRICEKYFFDMEKYTLGQFFLFMLMFTCSQDNIHGHKILVLQGKGVVVPLQVQTMVYIVTLGPWWFIYAPF